MFGLFLHFSKLTEIIHHNVTNGKRCSTKGQKSHKFQRCPHAHHSDELIDCPKVQDIGRREKYNEEYYFRTLMYSFYR